MRTGARQLSPRGMARMLAHWSFPSDFREHATACHVAGLLERRNGVPFETIAFTAARSRRPRGSPHGCRGRRLHEMWGLFDRDVAGLERSVAVACRLTSTARAESSGLPFSHVELLRFRLCSRPVCPAPMTFVY